MDDQSGDRISEFREEWSKQTDNLSFCPSYRLDLSRNLELLASRINQGRYDAKDVVQCAMEIKSELSEAVTPALESASSDSIQDLVAEIVDALEADSQANFESSEASGIIKENIDVDAIEASFEESQYNVHRVKSELFGEVAEIARMEEKKTLRLFGLSSKIEDCLSELESSEFQDCYRGELVDLIQEYLYSTESGVSLDEIVSELLGELNTTGWDEDSFEEAMEVLGSKNSIDEFCDLLRGELYEREYIVPLQADRIPAQHIVIGGVDFYMEDSDEFTHFDDLLEEDERMKDPVEIMTDNTDLFAVLSVTAPTQVLGEKRMERKLERAIDALNYSQKRGVLRSPFIQIQTEYLCRLPDGKFRTKFDRHPKYGFPHSFRYKEENIETVQEWFEFMKSDQDELTSLEKRVVNSYRWYGDGIQSGITEEEFLKYMISIESMLISKEYGPKKYKIAERLADLFGIYDEYRDSFKDEIVSLYDTRSRLVHNAEFDISGLEEKVSIARKWATKMFGIILQEHLDDYDELEDLLESIDELEIPEAPDDVDPLG